MSYNTWMPDRGCYEKILAALGAKHDQQALADYLHERARAMMEVDGEVELPVDVMLEILKTVGSEALPLPRKDRNLVN